MTQTVPAPSLPPDLVHLLETYCIGRKLGGGSFGTVRAASHIKTNEPVAIKIISRARMQEEKGAEDKVRREIDIMRLLRHPHIVRLYEVIETERDIYLIMEYVASGELFDFLNVRGRLHEGAARRFFQQLITGIEACHAAGVVHRDLKPENLLLTADGDSEHADLKIADFGLSNVLRDGHFLHTSCGSPNYAAPEVIAGRQYAGPEVDVWSAGCILFALLAGRLPFDDGNVGRLFRAIKAGAFTLPTHLSLPARDLQQHQAQQQHEQQQQQQQQQQQLLELQRRQAALSQEAYRLLQEQQAGRLQDAQLPKQRHSPSPPRGHQRQQQQQQQHLLEQHRLQQQAAAAQLPSLEAAFAQGAANGLPNGLHSGLPDGLPNGMAAHGAAANGGHVITTNGLPNGRHSSPNGVHSSVVTSGGLANGRAHAHPAAHSSSSSGLQVTSGGTRVPSRNHTSSPAPPVRRCGRHSLDASSQNAAGYGATGYAVANGGHMHG